MISIFGCFWAIYGKIRLMINIYGIPNCGTVKKARTWLTAQGLAYSFHDFKKQGVPIEELAAWASAVGWEKLLNRQGTTWRKLDAHQQTSAATPPGAQTLAMANPSIIKRARSETPINTLIKPKSMRCWHCD